MANNSTSYEKPKNQRKGEKAMKNLAYYRDLAVAMRLEKNPGYKPENDSGLPGDALELAIKDFYHKPLTISKQGHADIRIGSRNFEVKSGAGELGDAYTRKLLRGSGRVVYVPVVYYDQPLERQDGYVMDRADFLEALEEAGAIRWSKQSTSKGLRVTIQTFWIRSKNKPHGRLLSRMLDAFEARESEELCEFLEQAIE
jgi:hypothetical protein